MDEKEISEERLNEIRFINLVMMLSEGVMQHLGKVANPVTGKVERNLEAASATIDLIKMLKEKTKGNLSENESKALSGILANLQLNYVDEVEKEKRGGKEEGSEHRAQSTDKEGKKEGEKDEGER